jgi:hypothetical protein
MTLTPKMQIVWEVLESAKDCNDQHVIAACRRIIVAYRLGRTHDENCRADFRLVNSFSIAEGFRKC